MTLTLVLSPGIDTKPPVGGELGVMVHSGGQDSAQDQSQDTTSFLEPSAISPYRDNMASSYPSHYSALADRTRQEAVWCGGCSE